MLIFQMSQQSAEQQQTRVRLNQIVPQRINSQEIMSNTVNFQQHVTEQYNQVLAQVRPPLRGQALQNAQALASSIAQGARGVTFEAGRGISGSSGNSATQLTVPATVSIPIRQTESDGSSTTFLTLAQATQIVSNLNRRFSDPAYNLQFRAEEGQIVATNRVTANTNIQF